MIRKTQDPPSNPQGGAPRVSVLWQKLLKWYALSVPAVNKFKRLRPGHPPNALGANSGSYNINTQGSVAITYYLENYVLGGNVTYYDPNPSGNEPLVCQN